MTHRIALVSCVKSKRSSAAPAGELYTSSLFRSLRRYAEANADSWYILSAEHGLLRPDEIIEVLPRDAEVIVLAGARYREGLIPFLRGKGIRVTVPLEGLSFGRQLQRLKELEDGGHAER